MNKKLKSVILKKLEQQVEEYHFLLANYFDEVKAIPEHFDKVEDVMSLLDKLDSATSKLETFKKYFCSAECGV